MYDQLSALVISHKKTSKALEPANSGTYQEAKYKDLKGRFQLCVLSSCPVRLSVCNICWIQTVSREGQSQLEFWQLWPTKLLVIRNKRCVTSLFYYVRLAVRDLEGPSLMIECCWISADVQIPPHHCNVLFLCLFYSLSLCLLGEGRCYFCQSRVESDKKCQIRELMLKEISTSWNIRCASSSNDQCKISGWLVHQIVFLPFSWFVVNWDCGQDKG